MTVKDVVRQLLDILPEGCSYEDVRRHLELFEKIRQNQEAVMLGETATLEVQHSPKQ